MTESEARTKECPIYALALVPVVTGASDPEAAAKTLSANQMCRGSKCMMWRKLIARKDTGGMMPVSYMAEIGGYCGLAGNP